MKVIKSAGLISIVMAILIYVAIALASPTVIYVQAGGDLQAALNAANCGDTVSIEAGASFLGTYALSKKCLTNRIKIQSSRLSELPEGKQVSPADAPKMPKILSPGFGSPALVATNYSSGYILLGLDFATQDPAVHPGDASFAYELVTLGELEQTDILAIPQYIDMDRCYVHAYEKQSLKRGVSLNTYHSRLTNNYISGFKTTGQDAQAVITGGGQGDYLIENNYMEASGENFLIGGWDTKIPGLVTSNVIFRRNYLTKPLIWQKTFGEMGDAELIARWGADAKWLVKNTIEFKTGINIHVEGNIIENSWPHGQAGYLVVLTPRNQYGTAPWSEVANVTFVNNVIRNGASGVMLLGTDTINGGGDLGSKVLRNVVFRNNLFENIGGEWLFGAPLSSNLFQIGSGAGTEGPRGVIVERNTVKNNTTAQMTYFYGGDPNSTTSGFVWRGNIAGIGGFISDQGQGNVTLNFYAPGWIVENNDIINVYRPDLAPPNNDYPATESAAHPSSTRGVDMAVLEAALGGIYQPVPTPSPTPIPSPVPSPVPSPTPTPVPSPTPTPVPSPTPTTPCSLTGPGSLTIPQNSFKDIALNMSGNTNATVTVTVSGSTGQVTVAPISKTVSGTSAILAYRITVKKQSRTVTFNSTACGSVSTAVTVN